MRAISEQIVLVRGGGDLATAVVQKLHRVGFRVIISELERPKMVRRTVSLASAIYSKTYRVEDIEAEHVEKLDQIEGQWAAGKIPVYTAGESALIAQFAPSIFVDATLSKRDVDYRVGDAPVIVGLGPKIKAGVDADVVIETSRGHHLGRLIFDGFAAANSHVPGDIAGYTHERVLRAPCPGRIDHTHQIGDVVSAGDAVMTIAGEPVRAKIDGVIRGLIHPSVTATTGLKVGDIDPRGDIAYCMTISDKGRAIAGAVLEAILLMNNSWLERFRAEKGR